MNYVGNNLLTKLAVKLEPKLIRDLNQVLQRFRSEYPGVIERYPGGFPEKLLRLFKVMLAEGETVVVPHKFPIKSLPASLAHEMIHLRNPFYQGRGVFRGRVFRRIQQMPVSRKQKIRLMENLLGKAMWSGEQEAYRWQKYRAYRLLRQIKQTRPELYKTLNQASIRETGRSLAENVKVMEPGTKLFKKQKRFYKGFIKARTRMSKPIFSVVLD